MTNQSPRVHIYFQLGGFVLILLGFTSVKAQVSTRPTPRDVVIESNRQELDNLLLRKPIITAPDTSARRAALQQVTEDFRALQVLNNRVMVEITGPGKIDYRTIASLISGIRDKASRLKSNLALPAGESKPQPIYEIATASDFKDRLFEFDRVVVSFVTNSIFQQASVVEMELGRQASTDLAVIISQSEKLKKTAKRLAQGKR